ncbi:tRNA-(ms[2]io[6]A)-hydroxylase [Catalinimonas alkaloidigena]|uniref:tRNA-(Ms[2]io[6]A)-hydroxylase n=1 Tax=Catalinimonas alkaloidigena TaxID=1075417 RepID=A0A1G9KAY8_9BACT|nr:tRNA-(ms[2]io[6]A)-hydroxylase [Catalinimonas alkaloidigena]SDL46736.1 tRNA-(ms[2]io[6]A)-hydroxylase [Catalinimonas alkaloidigena]
MLGLKLPTDPRWVDVASKNLEEILVDHAYCEQKAASSGISLIVQYPDREKLVAVLTDVVTEEWNHFERVLAQLRERGMKLGRQRKDEYVVALSQHVRKGGHPDEQFLDKLLMCALIEARSCERFRILSKEIDDEGLREFYHELMISEAGHYVTFVDLAKEYLPHEMVKSRLDEMLQIEAEIIHSLEVRGDRMH